jgi:enamine deaminase RidA (YjgF/YER057c/UK114 family)
LGAQTTQILKNIETALAAAGAGLEHIIKWNVFVVEASQSKQDLRRSSGSGATGPLPRR